MILHHFHPEFPTDHYLLGAEDLAMVILNNQDLSLTPMADKGFPLPSSARLDEMIASFCDLIGRKIPRRKFTSRPPVGFVIPEWLYFTDLAGRHHFILHSLAPVFLAPFKRIGTEIEALRPIADDGTMKNTEADYWLEATEDAARTELELLAARLGPSH